MNGWPDHYILVGRTPMAVDMMTWARWFADINNRRVAETIIDETPTKHTIGLPGHEHTYMRPRLSVSTVFLGLDHGFGRGDPVLFETMIFGGPLDEHSWRYCTYADAERGHAEAVTQARNRACKDKVDGAKGGRAFEIGTAK